MISSGRFTLGEECSPYKITKYVPINSRLTPQEIFVHARKVPLNQLRQKLLQKQLKYMRLTPTSAIQSMTREEVKKRLPNIVCDSLSLQEMCQLLSRCERTRHLCMWHDHATLLKMGFLMLTVHIMYDSTVFYTNKEYEQKNPGANINIQSEVEQPEIQFVFCRRSSCSNWRPP